MTIRFRTGYDIVSDLPHGFTLHLFGRTFNFHWDWPKPVWFNRSWAVNEKGYMQGMPIMRRKPKKWLLRSIQPPRIDVRFGP